MGHRGCRKGGRRKRKGLTSDITPSQKEQHLKEVWEKARRWRMETRRGRRRKIIITLPPS